MVVAHRRSSAGFTLIELMMTVAIIGILAAVGLSHYRDYVRRAKLSEVLIGISQCKNSVSEGYLTMQQPPPPGRWGCESQTAATTYTGAIETSADGVIRISVLNLDPAVNGQRVYLVPVKSTGDAMRSATDLGAKIHSWMCGSDFPGLRSALPSNCRADTSAQAAETFE